MKICFSIIKEIWIKENLWNTPGTAGGPGGRDQTLTLKSKRNARKSVFFVKKLKLPKYGSFPEVGQKQKTERKRRGGERDVFLGT